jgi:hypothetical protein
MRQISENSPWPGVLWLLVAAAAIAFLVVHATRTQLETANHELSVVTAELGPAGSHQSAQWW